MPKEVIDIHIHFGAPEDAQSGCYWSEKFKSTLAYWAMQMVTGISATNANIGAVEKHLLGVINGAKFVNKGVLLAMDEVYNKQGQRRKDLTHLHVPNKYIADLAKANKRVLFGCSVHPYRADWKEQLDFCVQNGAVLCKWIPSSMMIDPSHEKCDAFYDKLAAYRLPLLYHAGPEHAIPTSDAAYNRFNNPFYLRQALTRGVTVIVAHCALPFIPPLEDSSEYLELLSLMREAEKRGWKLYADLSAMYVPSRNGYVEDVKKNIPAARLLFGTDYPIPISEFSYSKPRHLWLWIKNFFEVLSTTNPLDKSYRLIQGMGFDEKVFYNASEVLRIP